MKGSTQMAHRTLFLLFFLASLPLMAQISTQELPYSLKHNVSLPELEAVSLHFNEKMIDPEAQQQQYPMLAGVSIPLNEKFSQLAHPTLLPDGSILWHVKINVPGATALGLVLSDFHIAENEKLYIYDDTKQYYIGAFTHDNNAPHGYFSTHILPASNLIIEYHSQKKDNPSAPGFTIDEVIYLMDGSFLQHSTDGIKSSGACNVNVNCPEGDLWQKQKRGVARILLRQGTSWFNCTGSLVNNTYNDGTPYFLTSDHCGSNASSADLLVWQFYFNYEYPGCPNSGGAPMNMMQSGSSLVSRAPLNQGTDFKLLLLNNSIPSSWNPYFNGWSISSRDPLSGVGIHHPSGDAKKISTYTNPLNQGTFTGGMNNGFWRVVWEETLSGHGVTEGGSSGSPVFDQLGLIAGTLTGGGASCAYPTLPDFYGKFYRHWMANGDTPEKQLQPWLDPTDENPEHLFGFDPNAITNFVVVEIKPPLSGNVSGAGYYAESENVILVASASEGFRFINWVNQDGQILSVSKEYQFSMPETEVALFANFTDEVNVNPLNKLSESIKIYPNPAYDIIKVDFGEFKGTVRLTMTNITGQPVRQSVVTDTWVNPSISISLENVRAGIYFLTIESENSITTKKVIIK